MTNILLLMIFAVLFGITTNNASAAVQSGSVRIIDSQNDNEEFAYYLDLLKQGGSTPSRLRGGQAMPANCNHYGCPYLNYGEILERGEVQKILINNLGNSYLITVQGTDGGPIQYSDYYYYDMRFYFNSSIKKLQKVVWEKFRIYEFINLGSVEEPKLVKKPRVEQSGAF